MLTRPHPQALPFARLLTLVAMRHSFKDCLDTLTWQKWAGMTWQIVTCSVCTASPVFVPLGALRAWVELQSLEGDVGG